MPFSPESYDPPFHTGSHRFQEYFTPPGCVSIHTQPGVISLSILVCCVFQNLQILSKIIVFDMYVCHPSLPLSAAVTVNQDPLCIHPSIMHPETILCNHPPKQTGCMFRLHNPCSRLLCNIPSSFIPPCISVPAGFFFPVCFLLINEVCQRRCREIPTPKRARGSIVTVHTQASSVLFLCNLQKFNFFEVSCCPLRCGQPFTVLFHFYLCFMRSPLFIAFLCGFPCKQALSVPSFRGDFQLSHFFCLLYQQSF